MDRVPDPAVNDVGTVVHPLSRPGVFHTDLHKLLKGRVVAVVPVLQLVEVRLQIAWQLRHTIILSTNIFNPNPSVMTMTTITSALQTLLATLVQTVPVRQRLLVRLTHSVYPLLTPNIRTR